MQFNLMLWSGQKKCDLKAKIHDLARHNIHKNFYWLIREEYRHTAGSNHVFENSAIWLLAVHEMRSM